MNYGLSLRQKLSIGFGVTGLVLLLLGLALLLSGNPDKYFDLHDKKYSGYQSADIKSVEIDIGYGELNVLTGSAFKLDATAVHEDDFSMQIIDNVLVIKYDVPKIESIYMNNGDGIPTKFDLVLPNKLYEDITINSFNGSVKMKGVSCNNLVIESSSTDVSLERITVNQKTAFDSSMGDVSIDSSTLYATEVKCGTGHFMAVKSTIDQLDLNGSLGNVKLASCMLTGSTNIKCGMGDISIMLLGNRDSYGFSFLKGKGDIKVDSKSYEEFDDTSSQNNILIDGSFGNVDISFYE